MIARLPDTFFRSRLPLLLSLAVLLARVSPSTSSSIDYGTDTEPYQCGECECCDIPSQVIGPNREHAVSMNCSHRGLTEIPSFLGDKENNYTKFVTTLYLNDNDIERLETGAFAGLQSEYISFLYLERNNISFIDNYTFEGLVLNFLDISYNALTNSGIAPDAFVDCGVTGTLELAFNELTSPPIQLANMTHLFFLSLRHNPMGPVLHNDTIGEYNTKLESIDLSNCELEYIQPRVFENTINLQAVYLDNNNFTVLNSSFFEKARIGDYLSLQRCNIQQIEKDAFNGLRFVETLNLNHNNLSNRPSRNAFRGFHTGNLYMRNCSINWITRGFLRAEVDKILDLSDNNITILQEQSFKSLRYTAKMVLSNCNIREIRGRPFTNDDYLQYYLHELYLDKNELDDNNLYFLDLNGTDFDNLRLLDLSYNNFTELPNLKGLPKLKFLYATYGKLKRIKADDFKNTILTSLEFAANEDLEEIHEDALLPLVNLTAIDVTYSKLRRLPNLRTLSKLRDLHLSHSSLEELPADLCEHTPWLTVLVANHNNLRAIPDLANCSYLSLAFFDDNKIESIGENTFQNLPILSIIQLHHNRISDVHEDAFHGLSSLQYLHLANNSMPGLPDGFFNDLVNLKVLDMRRNRITTLPHHIFYDNILLEELYLDENRIDTVAETIFASNMTFLRNLNVSDNAKMPRFPFPEVGFPFLDTLGMINLPLILDVPSVTQIPRIQSVNFTYPYHCCIFDSYIPDGLTVKVTIHQKENEDPYEEPDVLFEVIHPTSPPVTLPPHVVAGHLFPEHQDPFNPKNHKIPEDEYREVLKDFANQWNATIRILPNNEVDFIVTDEEGQVVVLSPADIETLRFLNALIPSFSAPHEVACYPLADALNPCDSLLDPDFLRALVWIIWFPAVLGNIAVLFVTLASGEKLNGPQFVHCNLAFADFLLGVYLAFLAIVDVRTFGGGSFFKSALEWQTGVGCKTAGFIAVFASELSVLSLFIITLERLQTIAYSFSRGGSRFKIRHLSVMVVIAWLVAGTLATLPLFDINNYNTVAVCLPFSVYELKDRLYLAAIFTLNILVLLFILGSYLHILVIFFKSPAAENSKRERVILSCKMGVLVATNAVTWVPLTVVGLSAILDVYLIDVATAKFFVILILPFSSCLNPFLYGILTKQFWQRARMICKRTDRKLQSVNNSMKYSFRRNSIASSDTQSTFRTHSPRGDIDLDMLARRQSRRSFSVQLAAPSPQPPPVIPCHPAPYMGRRNSSPAIFGLDQNGHSLVLSRPIGLRLPSDPVLPHLEEEPEEVSSPPPRSSGELHRSLSIVKEETEFNGSSDEEEEEEVPEATITAPVLVHDNGVLLPRSNSDPEIRSTRVTELPSRRGLHDLTRHQVADMRPQGSTIIHRLVNNSSYNTDQVDDALSQPHTHFHVAMSPSHAGHTPHSVRGTVVSPSHTAHSLYTGRGVDFTDHSSTTTDSNSVGRRESVVVLQVNPHTTRLSKNLQEQTDV